MRDYYELSTRFWYPGRRWQRATTIALASVLIFLTALGGILPVLPGLIGSPSTNASSSSLTKTSPSRNIIPTEPPGVPLPAGTVQSGSKAQPSTTQFVDSAIRPHLTITTDAYLYQTSYGFYSFKHSAPYVFTLSSRSGVPLTKASFFFVQSLTTTGFQPGNATILSASDDLFRVKYSVLLSRLEVGTLTIQVDFQTSARPKFTVDFSKNSFWTFGDFSITWSTIPAHSFLKSDTFSTLDLSSITSTRSFQGTSYVDAGSESDPALWRESVTTDWRDARATRLEIGTLSTLGVIGKGFTVVFETNSANIDPTQVSTSTVSWATAYSTQRKTFNYGGWYYVFFYDGSNIKYGVSQDGNHWGSYMFTAANGAISSFGFDVYQSGSTVALAWLNYNSTAGGDGTTQLLFRKGVIVGSSISWISVATVASWLQPYSDPPSVAIGSDGTFWTGGIWYDASLNYNVWIYKSSNGASFSLSSNYYTSSPNSRLEALQLLPLPNGRLMSLTSHYYDVTIRYTIYNPLAPGGPSWSSIQSYSLSLPPSQPKWNLISAIATNDGFVHVLTGSSATYAYYNSTSGLWVTAAALWSGSTLYPSISSDVLGNIYAFWMDGFNPNQRIEFSMKVKGQAWGTYFNPFETGSGTINATWVSASRVSSREVFAIWTMGSSSPYKIFYGSIPLPAGVAAGVPNRPWSKYGLSPYEQYFSQNGEYVSPGNGLLTVRQTDISVSGRNGLSLSVGRIYRQPATFVGGNTINYGGRGPYWSFGNGWTLDFPWVDQVPGQNGFASNQQQFLHYFGGEIFPVLYTDYSSAANSTHTIITWTFANHQTEDFTFSRTDATRISTGTTTTTYQLTTKDGTVYNFVLSAWTKFGTLSTITDRTGQNTISFRYITNQNPSKIANITDTIGRVATFKYSPSGLLANVTYGGQLVNYGYGTSFANVTDAAGRITKLSYVGLSGPTSSLLTAIVYPTGGTSTYNYTSIPFTTEAVNYYVTLQTLYTPGSAVKSSSFSYKITDGEITSANVVQSDGQTVQGTTNYLFNAQSSSMTRTVLNATQVQMLKQQFWYDPITGRSVQQDIYSGSTAARSFYNSKFYDLWGNVIYSRDNIGHESYQSFANTDTQWTFQGPGSINTSTNGKQLYDDFNGQALDNTAWSTGGSASSRTFTVTNSLLNMSAIAATYGSWSSMWARSTSTFNYPFYGEVQMALSQNPCSYCEAAELVISPQLAGPTGDPFNNNDAVRVMLYDGVHYSVVKNVGGVQTTLVDTSSGGSWSVSWKIVLTDQNTLTVYLNRGWGGTGFVQVYTTTGLGLSSSFTPAYAYLLYRTTRANIYSASFDYVGLTTGNSVTVANLQAGQKVQLYDWNNNLQASGRVATGQTSITLDGTQMVFPYGYFQIYELDGRTVQFTSSTREIYGGSTYSYTAPFRSGGTTRTSTGFLQSSTVYVDDSLPSGATAYSDGGDSWVWSTSSYGPVVSGTQSHVSIAASGTHEHYFNGSTTTMSPPGQTYLIQYVYIPSTSVPSEIMLQFHTVGGSWEHRAYWGSNLITACGTAGSTCGTNGGPSRWSMGPLPNVRDSWVELVVRADDVGVAYASIDGMAYTLYNGSVFWDYSAMGGSQPTTTLTVNNLVSGQKVELYDSNWSLKLSLSLGTSIPLNMYNAGIDIFPYSGFIKIYTVAGALQYSSPLMTDIWGGDTYVYNQPIFSNKFNPGSPGVTIHSLQFGQAQYQNATSIPEESYSNFDNVGDVVRTSQIHNATPLNSTYTYDVFGNVISSVNPLGATTYTSYSISFGKAYPTNITRILGTNTPVTTLYAYNVTTGSTISMTDARGNSTAFKYDSLNRVTLLNETTTTGPLKLLTMVYNDPKNNFTLKNEKGNVTLVQVDQLGRGNSTRAYNTGNLQTLATQNVTYTWLNQAKTVTRPDGNRTTYLYDYSGRLVKTTNPDGTFKITSYDDANLIQTNYDENNHRIDQLYDPMHQLIGVREYYSPTNYYLTSYTYDGVGNLAKTVDAKGQITAYTHDDLNRLTLTVFPDGYNETRIYDNVGNLQTKKDPNGNTVSYSYDTLDRLTTITYPNSTTANYGYDRNNNRISLSYLGNSATFKYDAWNRLTNETWTITGSQYSIGYTYDRAGNLVGLTYPDNTKITYSVDPLNDISSVKNGGAFLANATYTAGNRLSSISYGNGVKTVYNYDSRSRPTRMQTTNSTATLLDLNYTYDAANNVIAISTETYSYDYLNRLTRSTGPWPTIQYGYDGVGNRAWTYQSSNTSYVYGPFDRLTSVGSSTYTYDNNGNMKTSVSGTYSYSYDYENRLTQIKQGVTSLGSYVYSPLGQRILKTEGSITTAYLNQGNNVLYEKQTSGGNTISDYVYQNGKVIAKLSGGNTYYFHTDLLGSTRLVTSGSTTKFSTNYQPFGQQQNGSGVDPVYKYTGKAQDVATGLYYFAARYYDVQIGRFATRDPANEGVNPYSYAKNNPETIIDPTGTCSADVIAAGGCRSSAPPPPRPGIALETTFTDRRCYWWGCNELTYVRFTVDQQTQNKLNDWGYIGGFLIGLLTVAIKNGAVALAVSLLVAEVATDAWALQHEQDRQGILHLYFSFVYAHGYCCWGWVPAAEMGAYTNHPYNFWTYTNYDSSWTHKPIDNKWIGPSAIWALGMHQSYWPSGY